jgi:hypothetical protein
LLHPLKNGAAKSDRPARDHAARIAPDLAGEVVVAGVAMPVLNDIFIVFSMIQTPRLL